MNWWLAPGSRENWIIALFDKNCLEKLDWEKAINCLREESPWGLRKNKLNEAMWNKIEAGDGVLVYVKNPVKGVIGYGYITQKFKSRERIWSDGVYPLRFMFRTECVVPPHDWEKKKVSPATLEKMIGKTFIPQYFRRIDEAIAEKVIETLEELCSEVVVEAGRSVRRPAEAAPSAVDKTRQYVVKCYDVRKWLEELSKMYGLIYKEGHMISNDPRVDVVWMRDARGVPSHVFEIESCGGDVKHSLEILAKASQLWNSKPYFIAKNRDEANKIKNLIDTLMLKDVKIITVNDVAKLYEFKKECVNLEKELGLP